MCGTCLTTLDTYLAYRQSHVWSSGSPSSGDAQITVSCSNMLCSAVAMVRGVACHGEWAVGACWITIKAFFLICRLESYPAVSINLSALKLLELPYLVLRNGSSAWAGRCMVCCARRVGWIAILDVHLARRRADMDQRDPSRGDDLGQQL